MPSHKIRPLENETDYDRALAEVEPYFDNPPTPGTPEAARFDALCAAIGAYEDIKYPMPELVLDADQYDAFLTALDNPPPARRPAGQSPR
jgi:antitoxin component HigA of HigAB toxin-antitoxin module